LSKFFILDDQTISVEEKLQKEPLFEWMLNNPDGTLGQALLELGRSKVLNGRDLKQVEILFGRIRKWEGKNFLQVVGLRAYVKGLHKRTGYAAFQEEEEHSAPSAVAV